MINILRTITILFSEIDICPPNHIFLITRGEKNNKIYNIQSNHNKILRDSRLHFFISYTDHNERGQKKSYTKEPALEPEQLAIELLISIYGIILICYSCLILE
jgi:hypothetical protein